MTSIIINCPTCKTKGKIEVYKEQLKDVTRGLLAINIARNIVCEHTFIAYIDKNLNVRDYFVADFQIELPEIASIRKVQYNILKNKEIVDIDLIKLNLPALTLTYILKAILSKLNIILISEQEFLYSHLINFFKYITSDAFELNLLIISSKDFSKKKKNYRNFVVFKDLKVIQNPKNILNLKKLNVEKYIINRFLIEKDLGFSYIYLRNEIFKAYELSNSIIKFRQLDDEVKRFTIKKFLEKEYDVKIGVSYLNFLINILDTYFSIKIPSTSVSFLKII